MSNHTDHPEAFEEASSEPKLRINSGQPVRELIVIDGAVADKHLFYQQLKPGVEIVEIDGGDGLAALAEALSNYQNLDALHIVSHAAEGVMQLGDRLIDEQTLRNEAESLAAIDGALKDGGDVLLFGCDLGAGDAGEALLQLIASQANVDVAASDDATGNSEFGGDWELEITTGDIEVEQPFSAKALQDFSGVLAYSGIIDMTGFTSGHGLSKSYSQSGYTIVLSTDGGATSVYTGAVYTFDDAYFSPEFLGDTTESKGYINFSSGETFNVTSIDVFNASGSNQNFKISSNKGDTHTTGSLANGAGGTQTLNWTGITQIIFENNYGGDLEAVRFDDLVVANVAPANTDPTISINNVILPFTEGGGVTAIDASATLSDSDGDADWNGGTLVAQITANAEAADTISIGTGQGLSVSGTALMSGGTQIATLSVSGGSVNNGTALTITLNSNATNALVQQALRSLEYNNTSAVPGTSNRTITVTATDNNAASVNDTRTISVTDVPPTITSATYDAATGQLVVTGTSFSANAGAVNDVDVDKLSITGEGGFSYSLTSSDVEITSATSFTVTLNDADVRHVSGLLNKDGTTSDTGTTYNLAATDDFMAAVTAGDTADAAGNGITVSNVAVPTITSATYNASTGALVVTGTNFVSRTGAANNDVDVSALTFAGEGGAYTLTSLSDVDVTSATSFTVTLSGVDLTNINGLLNKDGTSSDSASPYNLAAAEDWMFGAAASAIIDDITGNGITVNNVTAPTITSSTYNASTGVLVVTGTNFVNQQGVANDVDVSTFTFTGENGASHNLTSASDVEITSATAFSVTLSGADRTNVSGLLNRSGFFSDSSGTAYNLAAADNWMQGAAASVNISDLIGNGINVSNVLPPTISLATYDASTGVLVVAGSNFVNDVGVANDVDVSTFTFTGDSGGTYTLTSASDVEIISGTNFTITLSGADLTNVNGLLNKNGILSDDTTTYNLAAADNWMPGAAASTNIADLSFNGITVSNVAAPVIASATYDAATGALVVTGTNFVNRSGVTNDVDVSTLTFTGEGGATYTLTSANDVEITSATSFTVTLSGADRTHVSGLLNTDGASSNSGTTYNLAAADNWMVGAAATTNIADTTGNGITVSNTAAPTITSATYSEDTKQLVVTGTNLTSLNGASNDIDVTKLTLAGEAGGTHTLTAGQTANVDIDSATQFTVTIGGTDVASVEALLNANGTQSVDSTTFNLAAADDFNAGNVAGDSADATNSVTVSGWPQPSITSATFDASTGVMVVTGVDFTANGGADVDASDLTFTGESGNYTLTDTADVEIDNATQFTLTLSATDRDALIALINKDGVSSTGGTTYNLAAADDFMTAVTVGNTADTTGNGITVSNVVAPTITSAAVSYDVATGVLSVTGQNIPTLIGANNDIDVSLLTFQGEGGATYTLTSSSDVDRTSSTSFTVTLDATDRAGVQRIFNKNGQLSTDISSYQLNAAEDWAVGADAAVNVGDTNNILIVSNVPVPTVTSSTYDASTNTLVVTGSDFLIRSGAANDIDVSTLTFTGEGGATYTLTSAMDVEIDSPTQFTVTLAGVDVTGVETLLNANGTDSNGGTAYNLSAGDNWARGADAALDIADATGNGITVSGWPAPAITSATYDFSNGSLVVTGTNFHTNGSGLDVDASLLTFIGEGGVSHTLTDTTDVNRDSATQFTLTLSSADLTAINAIINKNGTTSTGGTNYNLAAADDFITGFTGGDSSDTTANAITVSNVSVPTITSASYDVSTGVLTITGTNIPSLHGPANDIDASLFTFTGAAGATYTLVGSSDVERSSGTSFTITLDATDKTAVNALMDKAGAQAADSTTYNLAAAEDWAAGADAAVNVVDATNAVTAILPAPPAASNPAVTETVDGVVRKTETITNADGTTTEKVTVGAIPLSREDSDRLTEKADIPLLFGDSDRGTVQTTVSLPVGVGLVALGNTLPVSATGTQASLVRLTDTTVDDGDGSKAEALKGAQLFLDTVARDREGVVVSTVTLTTTSGSASLSGSIDFHGDTNSDSGVREALIIDASALPADTVLTLNNIEFAVIIGDVKVSGGDGANIVFAGEGNQEIILGADDDELHGGDGDDLVGSKGGNDELFGDAGHDTLEGGDGNDTLHGGSGNDSLDGGSGLDAAVFAAAFQHFSIDLEGDRITVSDVLGDLGIDTLVGLERLAFDDGYLALDLSGNAGKAAKAISAVFGNAALANQAQVGSALALLDNGLSYEQMLETLLEDAGVSENSEVVSLLFSNVVGRNPTPEELAEYVDQLTSGVHSLGSLAVVAAEQAAIQDQIDASGFTVDGLRYLESETVLTPDYVSTLVGGDGIDTVVFDFSRGASGVSANGDNCIIVTEGGVQFLSDIERVAFLDTQFAFDLDGAAGETAKILSALFGADALNNTEYVGIGLALFDHGASQEQVLNLALEATGVNTNSGLVNLLFQNVVGERASQQELNDYVNLLEDGVYTWTSLANMAANHELNIGNVDLIGLASTGLEYSDPSVTFVG